MDRSKHLQWAKDRALAYIDAGNTSEAFSSIVSDLQNHPDTANHGGIELGFGMLMIGSLDTSKDMRRFINGFN